MALTMQTNRREQRDPERKERVSMNYVKPVLIILATLLVVGVLIWQGVTAQGNPDPTAKNLSHAGMVFSAGVLVFREGLDRLDRQPQRAAQAAAGCDERSHLPHLLRPGIARFCGDLPRRL